MKFDTFIGENQKGQHLKMERNSLRERECERERERETE